jgi:hypothetical protein
MNNMLWLQQKAPECPKCSKVLVTRRGDDTYMTVCMGEPLPDMALTQADSAYSMTVGSSVNSASMPLCVLLRAQVSRHLASGCKELVSHKHQTRCARRGCKNKEYIPFQCAQCRENFCVKYA